MSRLWRLGPIAVALVALPAEPACVGCTEVGGEYFAKELHARCCAGLTNVNAFLVPDPLGTYPGDDLPAGCGDGGAPPDLMVCVACGDGVCGEAEHVCNCPEDCPPADTGG